MSTINLLPWREAKRKELQAQFITALVSVAVLACHRLGSRSLLPCRS